jgi:hypothetical protein
LPNKLSRKVTILTRHGDYTARMRQPCRRQYLPPIPMRPHTASSDRFCRRDGRLGHSCLPSCLFCVFVRFTMLVELIHRFRAHRRFSHQFTSHYRHPEG